MFSFSCRPLNFPREVSYATINDKTSEDQVITLSAVEDLLAKNDALGATNAAAKLVWTEDGPEAFKKIVDYHLQRGETSLAFVAAKGISGASLQDAAFKKIFDQQLSKGDLEGAELTALATNFNSSNDQLYKTLANAYLDKGDFENGKRVAKNIYWTANSKEVFDRVLDLELGKKDFVGAVKSAAYMGSEEMTQKLADQITAEKPDAAKLNQIEAAADRHMSCMPKLHLIILQALVALFEALGDTVAVERLTEKMGRIQEYLDSREAASTVNAGLAGALVGGYTYLFEATPTVAVGLGVATALATKYPSARRFENLLGVGAGLAASTAGLAALPATGVGLATTFVTRIPFVQDAAIGSVKLTARAVEGVFNGIVKAAGLAVNGIGKGLDGVDWLLDKWTMVK